MGWTSCVFGKQPSLQRITAELGRWVKKNRELTSSGKCVRRFLGSVIFVPPFIRVPFSWSFRPTVTMDTVWATLASGKRSKLLTFVHFNLLIFKYLMSLIIMFKGPVHPKSKIHVFPLTCSAIYQSRMFWCELPSFEDIVCRDFCLLSNIMGLNGARNVVLTVPLRHIWSSKTKLGDSHQNYLDW